MAAQVFLGRYEMVRLLGEGSMGEVYLARDRSDGKQVAVKVMHDAIAQQPKFRELFEGEMELMSKFQHPNVVAVYEASASDPNGMCMVMEYVPGTDLEVVLRSGRLTVERTGRILGQLCSALQAAHAEGIIHRDLKPANVMVVDAGARHEKVKIMDFGLAKLNNDYFISLDKLKGDTTTIATGTAEYMAPEQVRGDALDHRGDLYSLGVMLFEMLTGKLPFDAPTIPELLMLHAEKPVPTFASKGVTDVPREVEQVVRWCLEKFPVERPQDAWELAKRFEKTIGQKILTDAAPATPSVQLRKSPAAEETPREATVFELEAYMPEPIAVVKLRGFVDDVGGELADSQPGKIRMRFGQQGCRYQVKSAKKQEKGGLLSWLGFGLLGPSLLPIDAELRMRKVESRKGSELKITLLILPGDGKKAPATAQWDSCCQMIYKDLRSYLMSK